MKLPGWLRRILQKLRIVAENAIVEEVIKGAMKKRKGYKLISVGHPR